MKSARESCTQMYTLSVDHLPKLAHGRTHAGHHLTYDRQVKAFGIAQPKHFGECGEMAIFKQPSVLPVQR